MTREEAIKLLKATNKMMHSSDGTPISDVCEALDMAIEALSAETPTIQKKHQLSEVDTPTVFKEDYNGCKNCEHQISPLRMCEWAEQGGDGSVHLVCPMWEERKEE